MAAVSWGVTTDPGRVRPGNEDNALAVDGAFIVADGMGGHRAGEVAAQLAVDLLRERLTVERDRTRRRGRRRRRRQRGDLPRRQRQPRPAGHGHHRHRHRAARRRRGRPGRRRHRRRRPTPADDPEAADGAGRRQDRPVAGADATAEWALVNVGDSRTYLFRHGRLRRVTVDHSYVQELVATGHITDDEARTHPRRNIVTRALGIDPAVRVDAWTLPVVRGDRFLVCSDGLVDEVRDDAIAEVLAHGEDPQGTADELVALANAEGGRDNVTVIVVDVLEGADPPDPDDELDLEPAWVDADADSTWAVDAPEDEATEFADLAALVAGEEDGDGDAAPSVVTRTDEVPIVPGPATRPRPGSAAGRPVSWPASGSSPCSCWRSSSPRPGPAAATSSPSTTTMTS